MIAQLDAQYVKTRPRQAISRLLSYALFEGRPISARGRWINPFVFALYRIWDRWPRTKPVKKPIFIVGMGRSGTTVLGRILSLHRDVGYLNEPKALWHVIYPDEDLLGNFTMEAARVRLSAGEVTEEVRCRSHRLYGAYLNMTGAARVVDKYPELIFRIPFVKALFPDARFILMVRDGWAACRSIAKFATRTVDRGGVEVNEWWGVRCRKRTLLLEQVISVDPHHSELQEAISEGLESPEDWAAVEWIVTMQEGLRLLGQWPDCTYLIRYEDLIQAPEIQLRALLRFCDLPFDEALISYAGAILQRPSIKEAVDIHPALRRPFETTLQAFGYCDE